MAARKDFQKWVLSAIKAGGGSATILDVAKHIWKNHEKEIKSSENMFFKWQYDMRWAATVLRKEKK